MLPYTQVRKNLPLPKFDLARLQQDFQTKLQQDGEMLPVSLVYETKDLADIQEFAQQIRVKFNTVVILAIGGSSLGGKTLTSIAKPGGPRLIFLESIDTNTVQSTLDSLDLAHTAFMAISKSGNTIEILSTLLLVLNKFIDQVGEEKLKEHFFLLTGAKDNIFNRLAQHYGLQTLEHLAEVGGRFSYTSNVGLLPAAIAGMNVEQIRAGARRVVEHTLQESPERNEILNVAVQQNILYRYYGVHVNVVMPYIDRFSHLTEWYRQLWAESLGKGGFGTVPVNAMGTVDQHSQLQLYLDGPRDKFYTFILPVTDNPESLVIRNTVLPELSYLKHRSLAEIMRIEADSTIEVLDKRQLPVRILEVPTVNEEAIGGLMMQFMLETILVGMLNKINPFGQECVEEKKVVAKEKYLKTAK